MTRFADIAIKVRHVFIIYHWQSLLCLCLRRNHHVFGPNMSMLIRMAKMC
jgi:hypothetical protein